MKCPICGKDVELKKKQIGTDENGEPVFNEYAICRDCKKQWNLDKQRAKKMAAKKAAAEQKEERKTVKLRLKGRSKSVLSGRLPLPKEKSSSMVTFLRRRSASRERKRHARDMKICLPQILITDR